MKIKNEIRNAIGYSYIQHIFSSIGTTHGNSFIYCFPNITLNKYCVNNVAY